MGDDQDSQFAIRSVEPSDREWIARFIAEQWGSSIIVTRGRIHDACLLPGFIAAGQGKPLGLVTFRRLEDEIEIVSLNSIVERIGIGSGLISAVATQAVTEHCHRVWLITTNDNLPALRFYQRRGFHLSALYPGALENSRRLKPQIPPLGIDGIPLCDEIELELELEYEKTSDEEMNTMDDQNLRQSLERLHVELEQAHGLDPETRDLLRHLIGDIQTALQAPPAESQNRYRALNERLADSIHALEDSHPNLVMTIGRVLDNLSEV
jgi:GNAT superfamily N-acetyltransferase